MISTIESADSMKKSYVRRMKKDFRVEVTFHFICVAGSKWTSCNGDSLVDLPKYHIIDLLTVSFLNFNLW